MSSQITEPPKAKVTETAFIGVLWAGTALSFVFLVFRLFVKIKSFRKIYIDDIVVIAAWCMLLAEVTLWQTQLRVLYEQYAVNDGQKLPTPEFIKKELYFTKCLVPITILFYCCIWSIKISFLLFFKRLISKVKGQQLWWWTITVVTVLTLVAAIADIHYRCLSGSPLSAYCRTLAAVRFDNRTFYANCASDVVTDCLMMLLWNVRIPIREKILLLAIFSLTIVTMVISILRVAVVNSNTQNADISWLYLWSNVEMTTSVIIACLASFRQLFTNLARRERRQDAANTSTRRLLNYLRSKARNLLRTRTSSKWPSSQLNDEASCNESDSKMPIVPLKSIHVSHNMTIPYLSRTDRQEE